MSVDSSHPSAAGYGRIADALVPAVVAAIGPVASLRETP
jgi:lysophospholipase L1-like esterase